MIRLAEMGCHRTCTGLVIVSEERVERVLTVASYLVEREFLRSSTRGAAKTEAANASEDKIVVLQYILCGEVCCPSKEFIVVWSIWSMGKMILLSLF